MHAPPRVGCPSGAARVTTRRVSVSLHLAVDPPELAKGRWAAPAWLILAAGAVVIVFAVVYLVLRFRRPAPDAAPRSTRQEKR